MFQVRDVFQTDSGSDCCPCFLAPYVYETKGLAEKIAQRIAAQRGSRTTWDEPYVLDLNPPPADPEPHGPWQPWDDDLPF